MVLFVLFNFYVISKVILVNVWQYNHDCGWLL